MNREVSFVTRIVTQYRVTFHERVRALLAERGIRYRLVYSPPPPQDASKGDQVALDWAEPVPIRYLSGSGANWQTFQPAIRSSDLAVIGQESRFLANYAAQARRWFGGPKLAFFGHGKNFQSVRPGLAEAVKPFWARQVDWWFAYTEGCAGIVADYGFPRERITVFNNSIDTTAIARELAAIAPAERDALRRELFGDSQNVGLYLGGIYAEKRIGFLLAAAEAVRRRVPDFQLLVVGGGPQVSLVGDAAAQHDWIHYVGPKFGAEKTMLASLAKVQLMPGLVGLGILDSFAYGTPMVTTRLPFHSPEIEYLEHGRNGVILDDPEDVEGYAAEVARILGDDGYRARLQAGAATALATYTVENMAQRFAAGVAQALEAPRKR